MSHKIDRLIAKINSLEGELEAELAIRRNNLQYRLEEGRVLFEKRFSGFTASFALPWHGIYSMPASCTL
jgi:hypothetical protein